MCGAPTRPDAKDAALYEPGCEECGSVLSRRDGRPVVALWCYGDRATRLDARCQAKKAAGAPITHPRRRRVAWRRGEIRVGLHVAERNVAASEEISDAETAYTYAQRRYPRAEHTAALHGPSTTQGSATSLAARRGAA